jgi:hypothetical protein
MLVNNACEELYEERRRALEDKVSHRLTRQTLFYHSTNNTFVVSQPSSSSD